MPLEWEKKREWKSIGTKRYCCVSNEDAPHTESCVKKTHWGGSVVAPKAKAKPQPQGITPPVRTAAQVQQQQASTTSTAPASAPLSSGHPTDLPLSCNAIDTDAKSCAICGADVHTIFGIPQGNCSATSPQGSACSRPANHLGLHHAHGTSMLYAQWRDANCCSVRYSPPSISSGAQHRFRLCELGWSHSGWHQITLWDGSKSRYS